MVEMSDESIENMKEIQDQAASLREKTDNVPEEQDQTSVSLQQTNHEEQIEEEVTTTASLTIDELNLMIEELCRSKAEEYHLIGYEQVTAEEIWKCVSSKYKSEYPALHVVVNDILSLKPDKFMNWLLIQAYKS